MGSGAALFDYDADGDLDVYAVQGARLAGPAAPGGAPLPANRLFRNDAGASDGGGLRFTDVTDEAGVGDTGCGMGSAVSDYDNDGDLDLYVTNFGDNVLYENQGDGTFADVTARAGVAVARFSASAAFLDYDHDGDLDLFVTTYVDFTPPTNRECFRLGGRRGYCGPLSYRPTPDVLLRNEGDGTFRDVSAAAGIERAFGCGLGVVCADFDGDGRIDLFVANDATPNQLWMNRGDGTFVDRALVAGVAVNRDGRNEAGMGVTAGDFDRDGDLDIFLTHEVDETNTLYVNQGQGFFSDETTRLRLAAPSLPHSGFGTRWLDYDHDGWLDLFVVNGAVRALADQLDDPHPYRQPDQVYRNQGGDSFIEVTRLCALGAGTGRGLATGDVDNDGDLDVLVTNNNGPLALYLNTTGDRRPWVRLRLHGKQANRDGLGATITLLADGKPAGLAVVGTDGSYLSASDRRVHFAVGAAARIEAVVRWPGSRTERFGPLPPRAQSELREGEGEAEPAGAR
jgi:hypothetical protein